MTSYSAFFPDSTFAGIEGTTLPATRNVTLGDWNSIGIGTLLNVGDIVQYLGSSFMVNASHVKTEATVPPPSNSNYTILAEAGADGQTLYTWFAYADSADGQINFTTGAGGNRAYIGIAHNKDSAAESSDPADYTWTKIQGPSGSNGLNSATVFLYQRSSTVPAGPSSNVGYVFSTGSLTGQDNGWNTSIPTSNGNPLYVIAATASSSGTSDTILPNEWTAPVIMANDGATGSAGLNNATIFLYIRSSTLPALPSQSTTYNFSTGNLANINNGWSQTVPSSNGLPLYVTTATALSSGSTDIIPSGEWAAPTIMAQDGATGASGLHNATVFLYQRKSTAPILPSVSSTYTFSTGVLTGQNNGWVTNIPTADGNPLYVTTAVASNTSNTDSIAANEWATPVILTQDGSGTSGLNTAVIFLYQRSDTPPPVPSANVGYTFSTAALTGVNNNWLDTVPTSNGSPLWVTTATALSASSSDTITSSEWAAPTIMAQDGAKGDTGPGGPVILLYANDLSFDYVDGIASDTAQTITVTASLQNTSETINWSVSPAVTLGAPNNTSRTLTIGNFGDNTQVVITAVGATTGATDSITLIKNDTPGSDDSILTDSDFRVAIDFAPTNPWRRTGGFIRVHLA